MQKAILWDNDGVLADTEVLFFEANVVYFKTQGIELTTELFYQWFLCSDLGAWHMLGWSEQKILAGRKLRNEIYSQLLLSNPDLLRPGMKDLVHSLHGKARMGVVTSSRKDHYDMIHRSGDLASYFEFVITPDQYSRHKPDPEPYLTALSRLGLRAQECIAVEDSPRGFAATKAANIPCIVIRTPLTLSHPFHGAQAVVDTVEALGRQLNRYLEPHI